MSETPPLSVVSSWVDLSTEVSSGAYNISHEVSAFSPVAHAMTRVASVTPVPFGSDQDYMRMLKEAQTETSCRSSARVSPLTSAFVSQHSTPCHSPKSPPNSPRTELADYTAELNDVYINRVKEDTVTDFMWDWNSTPCPPKDLRSSSSSSGKPATNTRINKSSINTNRKRKGSGGLTEYASFYTFLLTNLVSLFVGAGIGAWVYKRSTLAVTGLKVVL